MTDDHLRSLADAMGRALDTGDDMAVRRLMGSAIIGLIQERHQDRADAAALAAAVADRATSVDDRLARIEGRFDQIDDLAELAATARVVVGWCSRRASNLRAAVVWLTPIVVFVAAVAAARETVAGWWGEFFSGRR